jgi:hypothetical protein
MSLQTNVAYAGRFLQVDAGRSLRFPVTSVDSEKQPENPREQEFASALECVVP